MNVLDPAAEAALAKKILEVLSRDFSGVNLLRVKVMPDYDFDGDEILRVEVVFEGEPKDIEPKFLVSAIRKVRPALSEMDVSLFPAMSFISAKDAELASR